MILVGNVGLEGKVPVGTKLKFSEEKQAYTVRSSNVCFSVCTKPFNPKRTVLYTIIDWKERIRGPENLIFGMGAETDKDCGEMLERITQGESEISYRHRINLKIDKVIWLPKEKYEID